LSSTEDDTNNRSTESSILLKVHEFEGPRSSSVFIIYAQPLRIKSRKVPGEQISVRAFQNMLNITACDIFLSWGLRTNWIPTMEQKSCGSRWKDLKEHRLPNSGGIALSLKPPNSRLKALFEVLLIGLISTMHNM
jgi:hypothetical protein